MANTTWSPTDKTSGVTLSGSNLIATASASALQGVRAIDRQASGKWYWETTLTTVGASGSIIGLYGVAQPITTQINGAGAVEVCILSCLSSGSSIRVDNGVIAVNGTGAVPDGSIIGIAWDATAQLAWFRIGAAGLWNNSAAANPATGVGGVQTASIGRGVAACPVWQSVGTTGSACTANFGDSAFAGVVPAGFTSGFTAGAAPPTNALATQAGLEEFYSTNPLGQVTQIGLEMWASASSAIPEQMIATQVSLEMWVQLTTAPLVQTRVQVMA
jgi:hypothetical protein